MKKRICTWVVCCSRAYRAAVRSASLRTRNHCSMALSSSLKSWSSVAVAISSSVFSYWSMSASHCCAARSISSGLPDGVACRPK